MISIRNVSKSYGSKNILSGVNINFPVGCISSLIGPNGAGKSTILMMIAQLLEADKGEIIVNGSNLAHIPIAEYARQVATLRQSPNLNLRLTVEELVAFGRFPYSRGSLRAEDRHIIDESIHFLELDLLRQTFIDELSGGQRQLAYIAMTMAQQTKILLLDEPLNNLDMRHAVQIMRVLRRLCDEKNRSIILVIHDINFAANYSDHIVAIKEGKIHFDGPTNEFMTEGRLKQLYELDFEILPSKHGYMCNYFNPRGD